MAADLLIESAAPPADVATTNVPPPAGSRRPAPWSRRLQTLRYYRPGQVVRRAASIVRRKLLAGLPVERYASNNRESTSITLNEDFRRIAQRKRQARQSDDRLPKRVADARAGRWTFLGRSLELEPQIDWSSPQIDYMPRLWQFQLQYHEWLLDLAAADEAASGRDLWQHVELWRTAYSGRTERDAGDAWHPYCISRRIPAWLSLWAWQAPPQDLQAAIAHSLAAQAGFLARRVETDLGGNHLLENARALVLAGAAVRTREGDAWLDQGQRIIESELTEQILPHGEHFERSPMYHLQMIEALEDVRDATQQLRRPFSGTCARAVERMRAFSAAITNPDGRIPLLGDACFDEASPTREADGVQSFSVSRAARTARQIGDYWTYRAGGDFLLFDAGAVGPDHLPAHAHADLLTIEASFDHQRFIVDSGTYDYEGGAMRQYCRSTAAHNVLEIDGENQCDVWSRFRMGRRGWPSELGCGEIDDVSWASATHNAYRHRNVRQVGRWIGCGAGDDSWLILDWAAGRGIHTLTNRLHLHPDVVVTQETTSAVRLEREGVTRWLTGIGDGELSIAQGWYCPRFGVRVPNPVIELRGRGGLPAALGWQFDLSCPTSAPRLVIGSGIMRVEGWGRSGDRVQQIMLSSGVPGA